METFPPRQCNSRKLHTWGRHWNVGPVCSRHLPKERFLWREVNDSTEWTGVCLYPVRVPPHTQRRCKSIYRWITQNSCLLCWLDYGRVKTKVCDSVGTFLVPYTASLLSVCLISMDTNRRGHFGRPSTIFGLFPPSHARGLPARPAIARSLAHLIHRSPRA